MPQGLVVPGAPSIGRGGGGLVVPMAAGVLWTPLNLGSALAVWWDPTVGVAMDASNNVTSWTDRVSGVVASKTAANAPTWSATARNGKPGLLFSGVQILGFAGNDTHIPSGTTSRVVAVSGYCNTKNSNGPTAISYGDNGPTGHWIKISSNGASPYNPLIDAYSTTDPASSLSWYQNDRFIVASVTSTSLASAVDGNATSTVSVNINTTGSTGYIGQEIRQDYTWLGAIHHIIIMNRLLTTAEQQKLEGWESWTDGKAGANLPAGHPYSSRAPLTSDP